MGKCDHCRVQTGVGRAELVLTNPADHTGHWCVGAGARPLWKLQPDSANKLKTTSMKHRSVTLQALGPNTGLASLVPGQWWSLGGPQG